MVTLYLCFKILLLLFIYSRILSGLNPDVHEVSKLNIHKEDLNLCTDLLLPGYRKVRSGWKVGVRSRNIKLHLLLDLKIFELNPFVSLCF